MALEQRKLGKELTRVAKAGALAAVLVGPDDWARGEVTVRDLTTREQVTVPAGGGRARPRPGSCARPASGVEAVHG